MSLQCLDVNSPWTDPAADGHGRRHPSGIALVLHVELHSDHGRSIPVHAHPQTDHKDALKPPRQQTAVWRVTSAPGRWMVGFPRLLRMRNEGEVEFARVAVRVVIAS